MSNQPNRNEALQQAQLRPLLTESASDLESDKDLPNRQLAGESKTLINLEHLLHIESIYADILQLLHDGNFTVLFNKCTEWWDVTAPLAALDYDVRGP